MTTGVRELNLYLGSLPDKLRENVSRTVVSIVGELKSYVKTNKLSGQALNIKSGVLVNSIADSVKSNQDIILGIVEANGISPKGFDYGFLHDNNLGRYKNGKDHSYMEPTLAENEAMILAKIEEAVKAAIYE
jgi:hypothetical protein